MSCSGISLQLPLILSRIYGLTYYTILLRHAGNTDHSTLS